MKIRYAILATLALSACIPDGESVTSCLFEPVTTSTVTVTAPPSTSTPSTTTTSIATTTTTTVPATTSTVATTTTVPATTIPATTTTTTTTLPPTTVPPNPGLPAPAVGWSTSRITGLSGSESIQRPSNDSTGNFRTFCKYSHFNYDDAIIYPGQSGVSHLHLYFGNTGSNANSTAASIANSGNSTCDGGIANRSTYWVPALLDRAGQPVIPDGNMIYYKSGYQGVDSGRGRENIVLPLGLKLIAGNSTATSPQNVVNWRCSGGTSGGGLIPACPQGQLLIAELKFPQCWNGRDLDSPDHKSHVVYGQYGVGCPSSHPVPLPEITYNVNWRVTDPTSSGWTVSSDMGRAGGTTFHGDIITGWQNDVRDQWLANCTRVNADCHVNIISNSQRLF